MIVLKYGCSSGRVCAQVVRHDRLLLGLLETHSRFRDDHEGKEQRLPSRVLRLPALQSEVRTAPQPSKTGRILS